MSVMKMRVQYLDLTRNKIRNTGLITVELEIDDAACVRKLFLVPVGEPSYQPIVQRNFSDTPV